MRATHITKPTVTVNTWVTGSAQIHRVLKQWNSVLFFYHYVYEKENSTWIYTVSSRLEKCVEYVIHQRLKRGVQTTCGLYNTTHTHTHHCRQYTACCEKVLRSGRIQTTTNLSLHSTNHRTFSWCRSFQCYCKIRLKIHSR